MSKRGKAMFICLLRKILATLFAIISMWLSMICGVIYGRITDNDLIGILIVSLGMSLSYILSFYLYGFNRK